MVHVFSIAYIIEGVQQTTANGNISFSNLDAVMLEPVDERHSAQGLH